MPANITRAYLRCALQGARQSEHQKQGMLCRFSRAITGISGRPDNFERIKAQPFMGAGEAIFEPGEACLSGFLRRFICGADMNDGGELNQA